MTFGRTEQEWQESTPAQVSALLRVHNRLHAGKRGSSSPAPEPGTVADLAMFAAMPRKG